MNPEIIGYIRSQRVGVFAIEMPDGSPHAATVHYAHVENPLIFIFETERGYRKSEALFGRELSRASLVIGSNEGDMKTLQMDGRARLLTAADMLLQEAYIARFAEKEKKTANPEVIFFQFKPSWWRFTDWTRPAGKVVITSDST